MAARSPPLAARGCNFSSMKPVDDSTTRPGAHATGSRPQPSRQRRKDKVSGVLMDAALSRWLLALSNSDVTMRADVPPLRDVERQSANQPPSQFDRSWLPGTTGSQIARPTASRPRTPVSKPTSPAVRPLLAAGHNRQPDCSPHRSATSDTPTRFQHHGRFQGPSASRLRYSFAKSNVREQSARQARKDKVSDVLMGAGLSRCLLRSSVLQRPSASRHRMHLTIPTSLAIPNVPRSLRSGGGRQRLSQGRK